MLATPTLPVVVDDPTYLSVPELRALSAYFNARRDDFAAWLEATGLERDPKYARALALSLRIKFHRIEQKTIDGWEAAARRSVIALRP